MQRDEFEDQVMATGFKSCFGCVHYGDREFCDKCKVTTSYWEPNERWRRLQKKDI